MAQPKPEIEVTVTADLREFKCPYPASDPSSLIWLKGFKAGMTHGGQIALQAVRDELVKP